MTMTRVLAEKRRIIVPLVVAIIANVLLYAVVVFPLRRQVSSAEEEAKAQHELLAQARSDYQAAKATVSGKQQARSRSSTRTCCQCRRARRGR